jgi:hypothetical protein
VSTTAWLMKDKDLLARDYPISIEMKNIKTAEYEEIGQEAYSVRFARL